MAKAPLSLRIADKYHLWLKDQASRTQTTMTQALLGLMDAHWHCGLPTQLVFCSKDHVLSGDTWERHTGLVRVIFTGGFAEVNAVEIQVNDITFEEFKDKIVKLLNG